MVIAITNRHCREYLCVTTVHWPYGQQPVNLFDSQTKGFSCESKVDNGCMNGIFILTLCLPFVDGWPDRFEDRSLANSTNRAKLLLSNNLQLRLDCQSQTSFELFDSRLIDGRI
jgi:hypothetical protein